MKTVQEEWQKKVRRILEDPDGRAALKSYGIEIIDPQEKENDKPIVVILCPTYRTPAARMQDALRAMVRYTNEKGIATVYGGPPMESSVVHWSRNGLITEQLKSGKPWTHALYIDDDIVVEEDHLERLLSHGKDIVAGLCTRRHDPPIPNIRHFNEETGDYGQIWEWPEGKLIEGREIAVGTGLMLVSQHALEQVAQVYFACLWEKEMYGISEERVEILKAARLKAFDENKICYWFRFLPGLRKAIEYGEDIGFCLLASRYAQIPICVDTTVQPQHLGPYGFSIRDFAPYRAECILRAKVAGSYPMEVPDMKISILCPTRGRPQNVERLLKSIAETATIQPEVVFYVDVDDNKTFVGPYDNVKVVTGERITLSKCFNRCAEVASGEILMFAGDDIVFRTKGWDDQVRRAFAAFPDRLIFVHGDDGVYGDKFGTHGFLHRAWIDAVGYFCPPYFSSDYNDTWINEVTNAIRRRVPIPFVTEHLHPLAGKAEWDQTHKERLERHKTDNVEELYAKLLPERIAAIEKLEARLGQEWKAKEPVLVG